MFSDTHTDMNSYFLTQRSCHESHSQTSNPCKRTEGTAPRRTDRLSSKARHLHHRRAESKRRSVFSIDELTRLGFQSRILTLENANPVVFGEAGDPLAPVTLCIYGHYDVQAPDPLSEWHSDPFDPVIRDGLIYARGATDDKGNLFANIKAAETVLSPV